MRSTVTLLVGFAVLLATQPLARAGQGNPDRLYVRSTSAMGTRVTVSTWSDDEAAAAKAAKAVFDEFARIDRLMTSWLPDSDVSRINAAAGVKAVTVSDEVLRLIVKSVEMSRKSRGAFDITVGSFRGLWKFDQDIDGSIPDPAAVKKRLALVGYKNIIIDKKRKTVKLRVKGSRITLGGIAKGYAVDRAVAILVKRGFVDFILQAGGDLYISGRKGNRAWIVGIRDPRGNRNDSFAITEIQDHTFSTSGDYERSLVKNGVRYHHILDPATGRPATRSRSVTVMAEDAMTADALSTALFVIGAKKGMKLVNKMPGIEAVFVDGANKVHVSPGLKKTLKIMRNPTPGP